MSREYNKMIHKKAEIKSLKDQGYRFCEIVEKLVYSKEQMMGTPVKRMLFLRSKRPYYLLASWNASFHYAQATSPLSLLPFGKISAALKLMERNQL